MCPPSPIEPTLHQFNHDAVNKRELLDEVCGHLKTLKYLNPVGKNSPANFLYGSQCYSYSAHSASLVPAPIKSAPAMDRLLTTVNEKMGTAYNSMLINKYRDMNCALGPHKDDETCLEPDVSISTRSLGAVRRMHVSLNGNKNHLVKTITLTPGSLFTVMPDFQQLYFHSIAAGKRTSSKEK